MWTIFKHSSCVHNHKSFITSLSLITWRGKIYSDLRSWKEGRSLFCRDKATRATGAAAWVVRGGGSAAAPAGSRTWGGSATAESAGIIGECGIVLFKEMYKIN